MAIAYVGGTVVAADSPFYPDLDLTALTGGIDTAAREGDLVIAAWHRTSNTNRGQTPPDGWVALTKLFANDSYDANLLLAWRRMGTAPDTSIIWSGSTNGNDAHIAMASVWRGVDPDSPLDVIPSGQSGTNGRAPQPPAITPVTAGAIILVVGSGAYIAPATPLATTGLSEPASFAVIRSETGGLYAASMAWGHIAWTGGEVTPAPMTASTTAGTDSWSAYTIALRPASGAGGNPAEAMAEVGLPRFATAGTGQRRAGAGVVAGMAAPQLQAGLLRRAMADGAMALGAADAASAGHRQAAGVIATLPPVISGAATGRRHGLGQVHPQGPGSRAVGAGYRRAMSVAAISATAPSILAGGMRQIRASADMAVPTVPVATAARRHAMGSITVFPDALRAISNARRQGSGAITAQAAPAIASAQGARLIAALIHGHIAAEAAPATIFAQTRRRLIMAGQVTATSPEITGATLRRAGLSGMPALLQPAAVASARRGLLATILPQPDPVAMAITAHRRATAAVTAALPSAVILAAVIRRVAGVAIATMPALYASASNAALSVGQRAAFPGLRPTRVIGQNGLRRATGPTGRNRLEIH